MSKHDNEYHLPLNQEPPPQQQGGPRPMTREEMEDLCALKTKMIDHTEAYKIAFNSIKEQMITHVDRDGKQYKVEVAEIKVLPPSADDFINNTITVSVGYKIVKEEDQP